MLKLKFPAGVAIASLAGDITDRRQSIVDVELTASQSINVVKDWIRFKKLELVHHKTGVIVINN